MMHLPKIPYKMAKNQSQVVSMRGINFSNMISDGDIADSKNISARSYPYITTRKARAQVGDYAGVTAMTAFRGKFVVVQGTDLLYDGVPVGKVTPGEKQFAAINTKLVIMPDKVYLDGVTGELCPMGAMLQLKNAVVNENSITVDRFKKVYAQGYGGAIAGGKLTVPKRELVYEARLTYADVSLTLVDGVRCNQIIFLWTEPVYYQNITYGVEDNGSYIPQYRSYMTIEGGLKDFSVGDIIRADQFFDDGRIAGTHTVKISEISGNTAYSEWGEGPEMSHEFTLVNAYVSKAISIKEKFASGDSISIIIDDRETVTKVRYSDGSVYLEDNLDTIIGRDIHNAEISIPGWADDFTKIFTAGDEITVDTITVDTITATVLGVSEYELSLDTEETREFAYNKRVEIWKAARDVSEFFKVGDAVFFDDFNFVINKIEDNVIYAASNVFTTGTRDTAILERRIPNLDYICESDNRIWGCSNADNTIYASALGDPTNFFDYSGESTDSYAVGVGSEERFTACCRYGGGVLFFKEMKLHKVLGSYPAEYSLYSYDIEGVQSGCHKSLQIINEVLYYKGVHGVFAFNGSPRLISSNFGEKNFGRAVAGNDGDTYYISMSDGERDYLFAYETKYGIWVLEGDDRVTDFARIGGSVYMIKGGEVYLCGAEETETDSEWFVQFTPLYETIEGKKSYSRIVFRLELPQGSYMIVDVRTDGGAFREAGKVVGKRDGIVPVTIPINRCDKFEIRLRGKGKCTIHQMKREFYVGGER